MLGNSERSTNKDGIGIRTLSTRHVTPKMERKDFPRDLFAGYSFSTIGVGYSSLQYYPTGLASDKLGFPNGISFETP